MIPLVTYRFSIPELVDFTEDASEKGLGLRRPSSLWLARLSCFKPHTPRAASIEKLSFDCLLMSMNDLRGLLDDIDVLFSLNRKVLVTNWSSIKWKKMNT